MVRELGLPRRPVVGDVMAPEIELTANFLGAEERRKPAGGVQRAGGVLPLALSADEQEAKPIAQPSEVIALEVGDVVHRVVEVGLGATLAPSVPGSRVVVAGHADREREQVGPLERKVGRVEGAQAASAHDHLVGAAAVLSDEWNDLVVNPSLVLPVA
jgi:hypothetical protein